MEKAVKDPINTTLIEYMIENKDLTVNEAINSYAEVQKARVRENQVKNIEIINKAMDEQISKAKRDRKGEGAKKQET